MNPPPPNVADCPPPATNARRVRFGLSLRLSLAFAALLGLSILSAYLTSRALQGVSALLTDVGDRDMPALADGLGLVADANALAATMPRLAASRSVSDLSRARARLDETLQSLIGRGEAAVATDLARELRVDADRLTALSQRLLQIGQRRGVLVRTAQDLRKRLTRAIAPTIDDLTFSLLLGSEDVLAAAAPDQALDQLLGVDVAILAKLIELKAEINLIAGLLAEGAAMADVDALVPVRERYEASAGVARSYLGRLPAEMAAPLIEDFERLAAVGEDLSTFYDEETGSLFDLRRRELRGRSQLASILEETNASVALFVERLADVAEATRAEVEADITATDRALDEAKSRQGAITAASVVISLAIMVFYVWLRVARRLTKLADEMAAIAGGRLDVSPDMRGDDEIALMARMVETLRVAALRGQRVRAQMAEEFERSMRRVIDGVTAGSGEIERSSGALRSASLDVAERSRAVRALGDNNLEKVQAVGTSAKKLNEAIAAIREQLEEGVAQTATSVEAANQTAATIAELAEASKDIDDVRQTISAIAAQTNLLALNATIEAARAGDHGRGFDVVAREVKALAAQTSAATEDIGRRVHEVEGAVGDASAVIETMMQSIVAVERSSVAIRSAIEEQALATAAISESVIDLEAGGRDIAANNSKMAGSTDRASSAVHDLNGLSEQLRDNSAALSDAARTFVQSLRN